MNGRRFWTLGLGCISVLLVAACAGHSTGLVPTPGAGVIGSAVHNAHKKKNRVPLRILIPKRHRTGKPHLRHAQFVSASTNGVKIQVYAANSEHGPRTLLATQVVNLSSGSQACTNGVSGRTCTFGVQLAPPADDLVFTTWDLAPVAGAIPPAAKQLATASAIDQKIRVAASNEIDVTLGGVVASIALSLPSSTVVGGVQTSGIHGVFASTQEVGVNALDADGNTIVSDGYVDAAGNPLSVTVAVSPSPGTCGSGTLQIGAGSPGSSVELTQPLAGGIQFNYGAGSLAQIFTPVAPCTFGVAASSGEMTANAQFALLGPEFTEATIPVSGSYPKGIASGPDGALWFGQCNTAAIGRITTDAHITEFATAYSTGYVAAGPDAALWFTEPGGDSIGRITTGGTLTEHPVPTSSSDPLYIAAGPDNALWFTEAVPNAGGYMQIGRITTDAVPAITEYPLPLLESQSTAAGIAAGPDGNMWFADNIGNAIGRISTAGSFLTEYTAGIIVDGGPVSIASGPDGNLWFTEAGENRVARITTAGTVTEYPLQGVTPQGITAGPDGALWFTDLLSGEIGRVTTDGTVAEYALPGYTNTGAPGNYASPADIVTGPDGALWFTEFFQSKIGRLTY